MEKDSKQVVLAILGVLILVVAVVGVSFAMYSFSGTGSKENYITTGTLSVTYAESSVIDLTNTYPMSDTDGKALTAEDNGVLAFTVEAAIAGTTTITYNLYFDSISIANTSGTGTPTLTQEKVKFHLEKVGTPENTVIVDAGTLNTYGTATGLITGGDSFSTSGTHSYILKAWIDSSYELPQTDTSSGTSHANETISEIVKFKVKVVAEA